MAALTPFCTSGDIKFYEVADSVVEATVGESAGYIPVEIPTSGLPRNLSTTEKVQRLIDQNFLVQNDGTKITFAGPTLEKIASIPIPSGAIVHCGLSGTIFYAFVNTIFQWDRANGMSLPIALDTTEITSLVELSGGQLIVGDKEGNIHFPNTGETCKVTDNEIAQILPLSSSRCILCTKKDYLTQQPLIFDVEKKETLQKLDSKSPVVIGEDCFLLDSPLSKWIFDQEKGCYERDVSFDQDGDLSKALSDTHVLLERRTLSEKSEVYLRENKGKTDYSKFEWKKSTVVYDLSSKTSVEYDSKELFKAGPSALVNSTLFYAHNEGHGPNKRKLGIIRADGTVKTKLLSGWGVDDLMPFSDGECLCATNPQSSRIYILSDTGEILFNDNGNLINEKAVRAFHKLEDGLILVDLDDELLILKLSPTDQDNSRKRSITDETLAPSKRARKAGRIRSRLFVGEGTFKGVHSLIKKHKKTHPDLAKNITATELGEPVDEGARERVSKLQKKGVSVFFGIDGIRIHETFAQHRYERIHWNHPFGNPRDREAFKAVLPAFFLSCSHLQLTKDRVHVTLEQKLGYWRERQLENPIVVAATEAGYRLIRKRAFGLFRYPGYEHNKTDSADAHVTGDNSREFVFEKTGSVPTDGTLQERAEALKDPAQKEYIVGSLDNGHYFECDTDYESSSYESE